MSVYVGELHTDVVPAAGPGVSGPDVRREPEWVQQQRAAEARARAEWLRWRVSAEAFDD
jgi:hypothetical protein